MLQFDSLIDLTYFGTIRRTLNGTGPTITDVLFVRSGLRLSALADLLTGGFSASNRRQLTDWFERGQLRIGHNRSQVLDSNVASDLVDLESISDDAHCRALFLPPYYLVQMLDRSAIHGCFEQHGESDSAVRRFS
jgi:hypothetical protein